MALRIYNTLSRKKETFEPLQPGKVTMYVCGPTVYKPSHIGHMVGPVIFDTVRRYLTYLGYDVHFAINITDVDDKLIVRAKEEGTTVEALAEKMTSDYLECLRELGVGELTYMPYATEHIPEMIDMIAKLIEKGHAYPAGGNVYFDVTKDSDYGKLCNRDPEQMSAGARIEVSQDKRNPGDFALWKASKPGEPSWESPWGPGRPGWHIECSAMSMKYLGETLDIHGGGLDLQFPHHENELAQSESYSDKPFARFWMHNGLLKMGKGGKMAGSVGNVFNVADALERVSGELLRFFLINTHYRSPIDLGEYDPSKGAVPPGLVNAAKGYETFLRFAERYERITGKRFQDSDAPTTKAEFEGVGEFLSKVATLRHRFLECMDDDFNTGGAIGVLYELLTEINKYADQNKLEESGETSSCEDFQRATIVFRELSQLLGLSFEAKASSGDNDALVGELMKLLVDVRNEARKSKNFAVADQIRNRLNEIGITLEDRAGETSWRLP